MSAWAVGADGHGHSSRAFLGICADKGVRFCIRLGARSGVLWLLEHWGRCLGGGFAFQLALSVTGLSQWGDPCS